MLIDGKNISQAILAGLAEQVNSFSQKPVCIDLIFDNDLVGQSYAKVKQKAAQQIGIEFNIIEIGRDQATGQVAHKIQQLNLTPNLSGLLVQLPLPEHLDGRLLLSAINPGVDIDCLGPDTQNAFYNNRPRFIPPTVLAVDYMINSLDIHLADLQYLVIGQGVLVGKPITHWLRAKNFNVHTADIYTQDLDRLLSMADCVISATGKPKLITGDKLKRGAIVIDAGAAEIGGKLVGDTDKETVTEVASYYSPVPGGLGPVTVAMLCQNLVDSAKLLLNKPNF